VTKLKFKKNNWRFYIKTNHPKTGFGIKSKNKANHYPEVLRSN
jgi:hypothetical protein